MADGRLLSEAGSTESPPGKCESRIPGIDEIRSRGGSTLFEGLEGLRAGGVDLRTASEDEDTAFSFCCETGRYTSRESEIASK